MARQGSLALSFQEGLELFDAAHDMGETLALPMRLETARLQERSVAEAIPPLMRGLIRGPSRRAWDGVHGSLARRLSATSEDRREAVVLEVVRAEVAAVLGHATPDAVDSQRPFPELGLDSLTVLELRNRLNTITGLRLPTTVVFDHPTPVALAGYLQASLASVDAGPSLPAAGNGSARATSPAARRSGETLSLLLRQAHGFGMVDEFMEMLMSASRFRATFDTVLTPARAPAPVRLSEGSTHPRLICIPSPVAAGGPHQYAGFAKSFDGVRELSALPLPGFLPGELLPASLQVAVQTQAEMVRRHAAEEPFVLVGHSSGGTLAHALAAQLERAGAPPAAVVLIDTYQAADVMGVVPHVLRRMLEADAEYAYASDDRLTAVGAYCRLLAAWRPAAIAAPTLLIRASEPILENPADDGWRSSWDLPHTVLDVAGDHFTMMEAHAETTARTVQDWLTGRFDS